MSCHRPYADSEAPDATCTSNQSDLIATLSIYRSILYSNADSLAFRSDSMDGKADLELCCPDMAYYKAG